MTSANLDLAVSQGVAIVTMCREPVNALNPSFRSELIAMFDQLSDRDDVRAVVLASGLNVFSAGADLKEPPPESPGEWGKRNRLSRETKNAVIECSKPVVAAINGAAIGAGFGLAGACDILVASENATVAMPEIDVGLAGGASLLRQYFGRSRMRRMILTGMSVTAEELYRLGVVEACVPAEVLMETAVDIAAEIAAKSTLGITYAKRSLNLVELMPPRDAYRFEQDYTVDLAKSRRKEIGHKSGLSEPEAIGSDADAGPIGVIGFGVMGSGLATSLARSGRSVIAYDLQNSRAGEAAAIGASFAATLEDLTSSCHEILLVLPDGPDVVAVASAILTDSASGKVIIDCSTVDPDVSRSIATTAAECGAEFADAGMGGGASNAAEGSLLFMVGCEEGTWDRVLAVLSPIGRGVIHCGGPGAGVTMKAITNLLWLSNYHADVEALVFASAAGISPDIAAAVLAQTGAANRALGMASDQLLTDDFRSGFPVSLAHKDVRLAIATARRLGLDLISLEPTLALFDEATNSGLSSEGVASAGTVVERRHGVDLSNASSERDHPDGPSGR
jgi:enoyl-CoA hydratase